MWNKVWDALAALAIAFAIWKILVAPRQLSAPGIHPAPHAVFSRLHGTPFKVADQRGHTVFLEFYASWCEPCRIELPLVEAWKRKHPDATIVPVDVGEPRSVAAEFAGRHSLGDVALDPQNSAPALFGVQGFPTMVVIDSKGDVRAKWEGLNPAIALALSNAQNHL
ncbi:MAG: TlpA disulfide reductase family protein [Candidatus Cybelea sp.]